MRVVTRRGDRRLYWIAALGAVAAGLGLGLNYFSAKAPLKQRLFSTGEVQLSDGRVQPISHSLQIDDQRFYILSRQGDSLIQTSGNVQHSLFGGVRLTVEKGQIYNLRAQAQSDDALLFNLLYAQQPGSQIDLEEVHGCLYSSQTQQLFCPRH